MSSYCKQVILDADMTELNILSLSSIHSTSKDASAFEWEVAAREWKGGAGKGVAAIARHVATSPVVAD
jgi:hypothetical protein